MTATALGKWKLLFNLIVLSFMSLAIVSCYVASKRRKNNLGTYIPGLVVMALGFAINSANHLSLTPPQLSGYATGTALLAAVVGLVMLERNWRREKRNQT
jgi:hypothetical protein